MRLISALCGVVVAALCSGCLQKEVTHTVYLGPSGVVWSVIERDVRSDEKAPADRIREEQDYFLAASAGTHSVAQDFRRLGAQSVTTTWLRRERPYSVMTEGRFTDLRQLATEILRDAQARGDVSLVREGCRTTFAVRIDLPSAEEQSTKDPSDVDPMGELMTDLETYRFVLTQGRFMSSDGFEILEGGSIAVPDKRKTPTDGILALSLVWGDEGCAVK
jgi:hypothetical protein